MNIEKLSKNQTNTLKGIAIIVILIAHIGTRYSRFFTPLGGIGVAIFLILSGYGLELSYQKNGLKNFWKKRLLNVFIPYFCIELISLLFIPKSYISFILDVLLIVPKHPLGWYLNCLLIWYILFFLIHMFRSSDKVKFFLMFTVTLCFACFYFITKNNIYFEQSFSFVFGCFWAKYNKINSKILENNNIILFLLIGSISLILKQFYFFEKYFLLVELLNLNIKFCFAIVLVFFYKKYCNKIKLKIFELFGTFSFEFYLVHGYLLLLYDYFNSKNLVTILVIVLGILLSIVFYKLNQLVKGKIKNIIITT